MSDMVIYKIDDKDVHTEHCCLHHDYCKYGDDNCTVLTMTKAQSVGSRGQCFCENPEDYWGSQHFYDDDEDIPF